MMNLDEKVIPENLSSEKKLEDIDKFFKDQESSKKEDEKIEKEVEKTKKDDQEIEEKVKKRDEEDYLKKIEKLEAELAKKSKDAEEYLNQLQRVAAEFENYKKRSSKEFARAVNTGKELIMAELIKVLDNFENALNSQYNDNIQSFINGIKLIYKQYKEILEKEGLVKLESIGKDFNPFYHEALTTEEVKDTPPNKVVEEYQAGYMFKDKVLRAAKVKVSK